VGIDAYKETLIAMANTQCNYQPSCLGGRAGPMENCPRFDPGKIQPFSRFCMDHTG